MPWWNRGSEGSRPDVARGTAAPAEGPAADGGFDIVRRGYDRGQVDAVVAAVRAASAGGPPVDAERLRAGGLMIVRRGYARDQVEAWLDAASARLHPPSP
ncbi:hypothetical protein [Yinghuangia seranimata]|uniref:hypothetical protein n=1 Tax=Yinghuangia seranimata TaxID=408067 RepID=UPI00248AE53A|nr:hypothetical protein [Yinghuangia seranimata]MDI2130811.1 hypothetical protein [Yinghuangia seranimata]